jgi:hypothetical protein
MRRSKRLRRICPLFALVLATGSPGMGQNNADLSQRVAALEKRVAELERLLERASTQPLAVPAPPVQAPAAPAPAPPQREPFITPPELVPEIGKVGAEVGMLLSGSANPFHLDSGSFFAGFIDLPLVDKPEWLHGKISYEILVGMSQSKTQMNITSNVAQVANLTVLNTLNPNGGLANVTAAVTGTGPAPFATSIPVNTKLRLLQVVPFSFKYTSNVFDRWRFRPYAILGFGTYVTIHTQYPIVGSSGLGVRSDANLPPEVLGAVNSLFGGKAPFGGPLVAGQISQAAELEAMGLPGGHGNLDFGLHAGYGFEYRVNRSFSLGFDNRFNRIAGAPGMLITYGSRLGFHF